MHLKKTHHRAGSSEHVHIRDRVKSIWYPSVIMTTNDINLSLSCGSLVEMGDYHTPGGGTMEIIPPEGHIILPEGCIIPPEGRHRPEVEEARGRDNESQGQNNVARGRYNIQLARGQGCYNDIII